MFKQQQQKQKHRAPELNSVQHAHQEGTSPLMPAASSSYTQIHAVEEKKSYAMVTGLLRVLVASIAYQRHLFPEYCFELPSSSLIQTEAHGFGGQPASRSDLISNDNEIAHLRNALAQRDQPLIVLAPGRAGGVDKLLGWLDDIFKGLLERSLDAVQFSIYADKSKPSEILELYTFSFQYRHGNDGGRRLRGLTAPGRGLGMITTQSIRCGMVDLIDQLNNCQDQLPALPKERYLMCHLFHSPYVPRHYRPSGFRTCTDINMAVMDNGLWCMKRRSFKSLDLSCHCTRLEIDYTALTEYGKDLGYQSVLGQNMDYTRTLSRALAPNFEGRVEDQGAPLMGSGSIKRPRGGLGQTDEVGKLIRLASPHAGTEDSDVLAITRRAISQERFGNVPGESVRVHDLLSGQSLPPTQILEAQDPPALLTWDWKLRAGKKMQMGIKRDKRQWIVDQDDRVVRCECSCDRGEVSMLQCICCKKLQHYRCYGFAPDTHIFEHHCYTCLLEDTHKGLLGDLKSIAIFRQALYILYEEKPSSPEEFAHELHLDKKTTQGLIKRLDEGGYLASGRTRLSPVTTPEQLLFRSHLYNNPLTSISGFYEPRENNTPPAKTDAEKYKPQRKRMRI